MTEGFNIKNTKCYVTIICQSYKIVKASMNEQVVESNQDLPESVEGEGEEKTPAKVFEEPTLGGKEIEELFTKNTESFRCLTQYLVSHSSLLLQPLYYFPPLEDPGIDDAFNYVGKSTWFKGILGLYSHF